MAEKPILFSGEMVRAILEGRKTQTRRVMKPQPSNNFSPIEVNWYSPIQIDRYGDEEPGPEIYGVYGEEEGYKFPYGQPGDRLWVRETWQMIYERMDGQRFTHPIDVARKRWIEYAATPSHDEEPPRWKPSIHMRREYSRINLEIVRVRVERLQEITLKDIVAEGWPDAPKTQELWFAELPNAWETGFAWYEKLWNSINVKRGFGWDIDPWVWVIEFRRLP